MHRRELLVALVDVNASETVHAEPRESVESPTYRVNFWERPRPEGAWNLDAWVLSDVKDITEVLGWVEANSRGRRFEVFAEMDEEPVGPIGEARAAGLVRLLGSDPNAGESVEIGHFEKL